MVDLSPATFDARRTIIQADGLRKVYGEGDAAVEALRGVSLSVDEGEFVAIMGPSGSGKSTLLNLLGCLDKPTSGKYLLRGIEVNELDDVELARLRNEQIGFVFQQFNLLPRTSALENVLLPTRYNRKRPHGAYRERAIRLLEDVGLGGRILSHPNQLSGGMQQRVAIARALINDPDILFADEPTGNLDTKSGDEIMAIFKRLNEQGKTIILITHEQYIANQAKRTIHMRDGVIISDTPNHGDDNARDERVEEVQS